MTNIPHTQITEPAVTCSTCAACCCQLEVMLITDTGVPERYIDTDDWGGEVMLRLDDGWCAALDRDTMMCTIYERRPLICREFEMGAPECLEERQGIATAYRLLSDKSRSKCGSGLAREGGVSVNIFSD